MDWTQVFVILGAFSGMFLYLSSKIDGLRKDLSSEIDRLKKSIESLDKRIQRIEDRLEFSNKVVYIQHEELKQKEE